MYIVISSSAITVVFVHRPYTFREDFDKSSNTN